MCLLDLQENEVHREPLGRQGRPDPKEAQVMKSCDRPAGPQGLSTETESQTERGGEAERERGETEREGGGRDTRLSYRPRPESLKAARVLAQGPGSPAACCDPGKDPRPHVPSSPPAPPRPRHLKAV